MKNFACNIKKLTTYSRGSNFGS